MPDSPWMTQPLFQRRDGEVYLYQTDHLGTPQRMVSVSSEEVWSARYTAFGEAQIRIARVSNPLRFPGQYYDGETRLHHNYFRDYDPVVGRYLQSDPIGLDGGINTYGYVYQNPIQYTDPYGLWVPHAVGAGVNAAFELYRQRQSGRYDVNKLAVAFATGALGGFGSTLLKAMAFGAGSDAINSAYQRFRDAGCFEDIDFDSVMSGAGAGFLGWAFGYSGWRIGGNILRKS